MQIEVYNGMKQGVNLGSKMFQAFTFGSLSYYFIKGNSIGLRFLYGFLFVYWYNHVMTLGAYAGAYYKIPCKHDLI